MSMIQNKLTDEQVSMIYNWVDIPQWAQMEISASLRTIEISPWPKKGETCNDDPVIKLYHDLCQAFQKNGISYWILKFDVRDAIKLSIALESFSTIELLELKERIAKQNKEKEQERSHNPGITKEVEEKIKKALCSEIVKRYPWLLNWQIDFNSFDDLVLGMSIQSTDESSKFVAERRYSRMIVCDLVEDFFLSRGVCLKKVNSESDTYAFESGMRATDTWQLDPGAELDRCYHEETIYDLKIFNVDDPRYKVLYQEDMKAVFLEFVKDGIREFSDVLKWTRWVEDGLKEAGYEFEEPKISMEDKYIVWYDVEKKD